MKRVERLVLKTIVLLAIANANLVNAQGQKAPQAVPQVTQKSNNSSHTFPNAPQGFVVCTGWHALCSASPDCKVNGDRAICDCLRVNENHIVETSEIQDSHVKRQTEVKCTDAHPCDVDQAPICSAIKSGQYAYTFPMPGYEYVQGACAPLKSDPL